MFDCLSVDEQLSKDCFKDAPSAYKTYFRIRFVKCAFTSYQLLHTRFIFRILVLQYQSNDVDRLNTSNNSNLLFSRQQQN